MARRKEEYHETAFYDVAAADDIDDAPAVSPIIPDAVLVMDAKEALAWMQHEWKRLREVYSSARFEPEGIPPSLLNFVLQLTLRSLKRPATLYIPKSLSSHPLLVSYTQQPELIGEYAVVFVE